MPKYLVESPSGQTLEIEGDSPPTEKELDDIFASAAPNDEPASVEEAPRRQTDIERRKAMGAPVARNPRTGLPDLRDTSRMGEQLEEFSNLGMRAGAPAAGQAVGAATGPFSPVAVPVLGGIGGVIGEVAAEINEGKKPSFGKMLSAFISGAIPGASLVKEGGKAVLREGAKYATGELAAKTAETLVDEGELPSAGEAAGAAAGGFGGATLAKVLSRAGSKTADEALNAMRDQTFRDVREFGIVVPPSELGRGSDLVSSVAGKAATTQEAAKRNQFGWQKAVREDLGLGKEALPISKAQLKTIREEAAAPYREIETIHTEAKKQLEERLTAIAKNSDPHAMEMALEEPAMKESLSILTTLAAADVNALKKTRKTMQDARTAFFNGNPGAYETWQKAKADSEALETAIERAAASLKDGTLLSRLKESRQKIAKTYSVEDALNPGNGFVDPVAFGRQLVNGEPLSGNLEKIAKFQLAFRREAVEAGRVPAPGVGNLGAQLSTGMASQGDAPGVIGAVVNATAGRAARPFLLSDMVQGAMLNPVERQNFAAVMARYLAENEAERLAEQEAEQSAPAQ